MPGKSELAERIVRVLEEAGYQRHRPAIGDKLEQPGYGLVVFEGAPYGHETVQLWHEPSGEEESQWAGRYVSALWANPDLAGVDFRLLTPAISAEC